MNFDTALRRDGSWDLERAILEVEDRLPERLKPLARLTFNYRWCWLPDGAALFRDIDPARWGRSGCNPRYVIEATSPRRLQDVSASAAYLDRLDAALAAFEADMARPPADTGITADRPVAYICSEYGVHCSLPLFGGGLGVLAGDFLKAASDLAVPFVGVGLAYREGYFHQRLDMWGGQVEYWVNTEFERAPAVLVTGPDHDPLTVEVGLRGRSVRVQIWRIDVGRVPLYLLDSDLPENHAIDRAITSRLYVGDRHTRLAQYGLLGIGGVRALAAMGITPGIVHLNEGHGALGVFERAHQLVESNGASFESALASVRARTVFTTHTPIPAGNEGYAESEIEPVLGGVAAALAPSRSVFYGLGRIHPDDPNEPVSITTLALRASRGANGVSRRHGEVAREMWQALWPDRVTADVPIGYVTNGVHTLSWMASPMQRLLDRYLSPIWRSHLSDAAVWEGIDAIPDGELWAVRCELRRMLVQYVRDTSVRNRIGRGEDPEYVDAAARVFNPEVLTVGFARRVATYKRLYLLYRLPMDAVGRLLGDGPRPLQLVTAGKAHPQDSEAKETLRAGFRLRLDPNVARRVVFLEDYDLHMAPRIVAGVDLWLNLPRPPLEACGTSGMKVALNGGLNLSVLDGWWIEGYDGSNGWAIETPAGDPDFQDDHDARATVECVEGQVIPLFYERDAEGIPRGWVQKIKASMRSLVPRFTAERMLRDYVETMYRQRDA